MNEFLNEKVNLIVSTKSGSGTDAGNTYQTIANNTINIRGVLKSIEKQFIILEDVQLVELPQYAKNFAVNELVTLNYSYKKTAVNIDNIITISIV